MAADKKLGCQECQAGAGKRQPSMHSFGFNAQGSAQLRQCVACGTFWLDDSRVLVPCTRRVAEEWFPDLDARILAVKGWSEPPETNVAEEVRQWFTGAGGAELELPDGQRGRPGDCYCHLTYAALRPRSLILELDRCILLVFTEVPEVRASEDRLVLDGFDQLIVIDLGVSARGYRSGSVTFLGRVRPGTPRLPVGGESADA